MLKAFAHAARIMLMMAFFAAPAGLVFARLVLAPSAILVDPDRPSIDRAMRPGDRAVGNDATRVFVPHHLKVAGAVNRMGRIPGWDASGFGGRPLIGNPQAGLWYPPTWLMWRSWSFSAPGWATIGHLIWGGLGIFSLLRTQGCCRIACYAAGVAWIYAPYVLSQAYEGHYPHVWAASWFPWTFWAASCLRKRWLVAPMLALGFLTGHPQETYDLAILLGIWLAGSIALQIRRGNLKDALRDAAMGLVIAALVFGMTCIEWLPDAHAQPWTLRAARMSARDAGKYHVNNLNLIQLLSPRALGGPADYFGPGSYWEPLLSMGWAGLVLIAVAVARSPRRQFVRGWLLLVVGSIAFAWGPRLGLFRLFFAVVPGMDRFRVPARALFLATTGAAVLVGLGVEAISLDAKPDRGRFLRCYRMAVAGLVAALGWCFFHDPGTSLGTDRDVWIHAAARVASGPIFLVAIVGTTLALEWLRIRPGDRRIVAAVLGLLSIAELGLYGHDLIRVSPASRFVGPDEANRMIEFVRPITPFRVRARDVAFGDLRAAVLGLEKTNVNDSFQVQHAADVYEALYGMLGGELPPRLARRDMRGIPEAVLDRMNVQLILSDGEEPGIAWPEAARWPGLVVYENPEPMPRAYVVPRVQRARDEASVVAGFAEIPAREAVFLSTDPLGGRGPRQPFTPADYESDDPDCVIIRVTTQAAGLLVVADTWMPGWSAEVNGREAEILRGNHAQRVVPLPSAGSHRVVMRYKAPGLAAGRAISTASLAAWAVVFAISLRIPSRTRDPL